MKLRAFDNRELYHLLTEAAAKIERGEPLLFPKKGLSYLEGPAIVALLRGLAGGKSVGQVLQAGRPKKRSNLEVVGTVDRFRKALGSLDAACESVAKEWHKGRLRGQALAREAAAVKKLYQRARLAMKATLAKIQEAELEGKAREGQKGRDY